MIHIYCPWKVSCKKDILYEKETNFRNHVVRKHYNVNVPGRIINFEYDDVSSVQIQATNTKITKTIPIPFIMTP